MKRSHRHLLRCAVICLAAVCLGPSLSGYTAPSESLDSLLQAYDRGDYTEVDRDLAAVENIKTLDHLDSDLSKHARDWIQAAQPIERHRRALVAGALTLDLTHVLVTRESWITGQRWNDHAAIPASLPTLTRLITDGGGPSTDDRDRLWALACVATWQDWDAITGRSLFVTYADTRQPGWVILAGGPPLRDIGRIQETIGTDGYLNQLVKRFPHAPRFALALAEGHEGLETRCAALFCHDEVSPATLENLHRRAHVSPPDGPGADNATRRHIHDTAVVNLAAFDRLLPIAAEFANLAVTYPDIRSEADVHVGYLAIRAARPDAALGPLATAATSPDPYVRYLAEFFTGRALEALGRRDPAIAAYRRALGIVPNAASAATLLSVQLFESNDNADRLEAHRVLEDANAASPRPADPWDLYWEGDARLRSTYVQRLREALKP